MASGSKYEELIAEDVAYHKASTPLEDMPSCTTMFDKWAQCFALGPQIKAVYRYGGLQDCRDKLDDFKFCLTMKGMSPEEKYETWIRRKAEKTASQRLGRESSENVWQIRSRHGRPRPCRCTLFTVSTMWSVAAFGPHLACTFAAGACTHTIRRTRDGDARETRTNAASNPPSIFRPPLLGLTLTRASIPPAFFGEMAGWAQWGRLGLGSGSATGALKRRNTGGKDSRYGGRVSIQVPPRLLSTLIRMLWLRSRTLFCAAPCSAKFVLWFRLLVKDGGTVLPRFKTTVAQAAGVWLFCSSYHPVIRPSRKNGCPLVGLPSPLALDRCARARLLGRRGGTLLCGGKRALGTQPAPSSVSELRARLNPFACTTPIAQSTTTIRQIFSPLRRTRRSTTDAKVLLIVAGNVVELIELLERLANQLHAPLEILLVNHQRRGETDDVDVSRLGQQTQMFKQQAELPRAPAFGRLCLVDDNGVEQTPAADTGKQGVVDLHELLAELFAKLLCALGKLFVDQHVDGSAGDGASERVAAVRRTVLARLDAQHHLAISQNGRDRVDAARERLAERDNVRAHAVVLVAEHLARPAEPGLDLVADEEHVVLAAQLLDALEVSIAGHDNARLALDRLHEERGDLVAVLVEDLFEVVCIVVADVHVIDARTDAVEEGTETGARLGVGGHGDDAEGAAVEVACDREQTRLALGDALLHVAPLARELERRLDRLGARVHGKHHLVSKRLGDLFGKGRKGRVVEGARAERELLRLRHERAHNVRVAVALVDRTVGGEEVEVLTSLGVPDVGALRAVKDDGQRVVVVRAVLGFLVDGLLGGERVGRGGGGRLDGLDGGLERGGDRGRSGGGGGGNASSSSGCHDEGQQQILLSLRGQGRLAHGGGDPVACPAIKSEDAVGAGGEEEEEEEEEEDAKHVRDARAFCHCSLSDGHAK
ncbi:hypothetical protein L1887_62519 [Cichorium endivia]|nr:hypothetical protein L1887_62519 [Cichorium endivia]